MINKGFDDNPISSGKFEPKELMQLFLDTAPIMLVYWDEDLKPLDCNQATLDFYGFSKKTDFIENIVDKTAYVRSDGKQIWSLWNDELRKIFETGFVKFEFTEQRTTGETVDLAIEGVRMVYNNETIVVTYSSDITQLNASKREVEQTQEALKYREELLNIGHQAARLLLTATEENTLETLMKAMEIIGCFMDVDRVQIWLNEEIDGELYYIMKYDWLSELGKQKTLIPIGLKGTYSSRAGWLEMFLRGECFNGPISKLSADDVEYLDSFDAVSLVAMPLFLNNEFIGFFSIDDCREERRFTGDEMDVLSSMGLMITSVFNRMEQARIRKEMEMDERAHFIMEATPIAVILHDRNMTPIDCNERAASMLGFANKDEYLQKFYTLTTPNQPDGRDSIETVSYYQSKAFDEGYARMPEFICRRLDGTLFPIESNYIRIRYKNDFAIVEYSSDISEKVAARERERKLENKLREQEVDERIQLMFDATPLMIEYWDKDCKALDCNKTTLDYYGYSDKKDYLANPYKYFPNYQPDGSSSQRQWQFYLKEIFKTGFGSFEFTLDVNGETVFLEVEGIRVTYNNDLSVVTYSNDLTQLRKLQKEQQRIEIAEESNRAKSRFLARMSHEIRTPVTAILGISEIQLHNPNLSPNIEEAFAKIHNSSNSLLGIINDILDHSKIESGKIEIVQEKYDVSSIINDVSYLHIVHLDNKDIKFYMDVDEELPVSLIGDSLRIGQLMNNLLSNAFKYTEAGSVGFSLRCQKTERDYAMLIFSVSDTGLGMSPEQLKTIHTEYERFHERDRSVAGTGLGMSIVYNLVQMMDGTINIESEVAKGTVVTVYIPQKIANKEVLGKEAALRLQKFEGYTRVAAKKFKFEPEPMPYGNVLIVDDVDANLYVAKGLLAFYDLTTETCDNGYDAIEKIKRGREYDLILLDYMMPGLDGLETMRIMREIGYKLPIVALTANAMMGQAEKFIESGFDGFISKPIQTRYLNTILNKYIRDKQPPEVILNAKAGKAEDLDGYLSGAKLKEKLRSDFAKKNKDDFLNIEAALSDGDMETAQRLAHSLKGVAGLIAEDALVRAAADVEDMLANSRMPSKEQLMKLDIELAHVLKGIAQLETEQLPAYELLASDKTAILFAKLEPLLVAQNVESVELLDELRMIPETLVLCRQIENFDFKQASETLAVLMAFSEER